MGTGCEQRNLDDYLVHTREGNRVKLKQLLITLGIGFVLGTVGGLFLSKWIMKQPIVAAATGGTTGVTQYILDLISNHEKELKRVTDSSRVVIAQNAAYSDSIKVLHAREALHLADLGRATTTVDSLAQCSLVVLDCQARAKLAEDRATALQKQLTRQVVQIPKRCGLDVGPGTGITLNPVKVNFEPIQVGIHCRLANLF